MTRFLVLFCILSLWPLPIRAASCCGAGGGGTAIILGDDRSLSAFGISYSSVIGDTDDRGEAIFRSDKNKDYSFTAAVQHTQVYKSFWQFGLRIPYVQRTRELNNQNSSASGLGDLLVYGAHEAWPLEYYSKWKPRGFIIVQCEAPTSPSVYDSMSNLGDDIRGYGFWRPGVGVFLAKSRGAWDASLRADIKQPLAREFQLPSGARRTVAPGPNLDGVLSVGYSPKTMQSLRYGLSFGPSYQAAKTFSDAASSREQLLWNLGLSFGVLLSRIHSLQLLYNDQTVLGPSYNSILARTTSLTYEYRLPL